MIEKFVDFQIKHAKILLILFILLLGFSANIAKDIQVDPDFGTLIPKDSQYNTNDRILNKAFETNDAIVLYIGIDKTSIIKDIPNSMQDEKVQTYLKELNNILQQSQYITQISDPVYSESQKSVQIILSLNTPQKVGSLTQVKEEIDFLINQIGTPAGIETIITGFPVLIDRIPTLLINDNLNTIIITLIAVFLILYWYSRDIYFTISAGATPLASIIFLGTIMVLLDINITITLAAVGVLVLGLGVDYSIHISTHYAKAREEHETHKEALIHTIESLALPITASFITTLAGFGALIFGVSPSSQAQGIVLALAIALIYSVTMLLFPLLITVFANKIDIKPNYVFDKIVIGLGKLAKFQIKYAKIIIWSIAIMTVIMMYGASQVQFSTSNSNWIPDGDKVSESFRQVVNDFGGNRDSITIILLSQQGDLRDVQVAKDVNILISKLESIPNLDSISSPYTNLELDKNELFQELTYNENLRNQFNNDWTLTRITLVSRNAEQDEAGKSRLLKDVKQIVEETPVYNTKTTLYGNAVRFDELGDSLQQDAGVTTIIGLSLVFFVASVIYASITVGFLSLLPIIIAVIWAVGLMGFFNVPFTSLSTGIISLVLGIGVDFSIHLVDGIKRYSKKYNFSEAVYKTMTVSGKAIILASITTFLGFLALTLAQLLGTQRLGFSLAFSILSVFIVSILLVPSVMSISYRRKLKKQARNN